ncbi:unnamed protein product, partial [Rotaria magnacalcarata]
IAPGADDELVALAQSWASPWLRVLSGPLTCPRSF